MDLIAKGAISRMNKGAFIAVVTAVGLLAGCATTQKATSDSKTSVKPTQQTIVLKNAVHLGRIKGQAWLADEYYRITEVSGMSRAQLNSAGGELWLLVVKKTGFMGQERTAIHLAEIYQIQHDSGLFYVLSRQERAAGAKKMHAYEHARFYACEPGANPKDSQSRCMEPETVTASMFYASDVDKPREKASVEMEKFLVSISHSDAVNILTVEEYETQRTKWLTAYQNEEARKRDREKQKMEEMALREKRAREFLMKSGKGAQDSCRSYALLGDGEPAVGGTTFVCGGSGMVMLSELQYYGWTVTSMFRERTVSTFGLRGNTVMITVQKQR